MAGELSGAPDDRLLPPSRRGCCPHRPARRQARPPTTAARASARRADRSSPAPGGCRCRSVTRRSPAPRAARGSWRSPTRCPSPQARPNHPVPSSGRTAQAPAGAPRSGPPSAPPIGDDLDLAEIAVNVQRYGSHIVSPRHRPITRRTWWANDIDGSALAAHPGKSQGRPMKSSGSPRPSSKNGLPSLRSPEGPMSRSAEPKPAAAQHQRLHSAVSCHEKQKTM